MALSLKERDDVSLTWIFATFVSPDEAYYEEDQDEEGDGAHQSNKPSLSGNVNLSDGHSWTQRVDCQSKSHTKQLKMGVSFMLNNKGNQRGCERKSDI